MCSSLAFSAIASVEAAQVGANKDLISLSEQQVVDCNSGCMGGWFNTVWKYIHDAGGVNSEEDYPYEGRDFLPCRADSNSFVATVTECHGGFDEFCDDRGVDGDESNFVKALNDRPQSVVVDASFFASYRGGIYDDDRCSGSSINHAVFAVGYGSENGHDYYIVKNSWGKSWGESGYIRMARGTSTNGGLCGIANYPAYAIA